MRNRFLGSVAALVAGSGLAWGQVPGTPPQGYANGGNGIMAASHDSMIAPPGGGLSPSESALMSGGDPGYPAPGNFQGMFQGGGGVPSSGGFTGWPIIWGSVEYLFWVPKTLGINYPLATTGALSTGGALGAAATGPLFNGDANYPWTSGYRITIGGFYGEDRRCGFELSGWQMGTTSKTYVAGSDGAGNPLIARPYVDSTTNTQAALLVSGPNTASGNMTINLNTSSYSAEANFLLNLFRSCPGDECGYGVNVNLLGGVRYFNLDEHLSINSNSTVLDVPGSQGVFFAGVQQTGTSIVGVTDLFHTNNNFYGGQVGFQAEIRNGRAYLALDAKLGLGDMHEIADIQGSSSLTRGFAPGATTSTAVGGLFANTNTIGRYLDDEFTIIPDIKLALGYHLLKCLTVEVSYNFVYVSNVARPTSVLNPLVNPATIPTSSSFGTNLPVVPTGNHINQSDYSLNGLAFGVTFSY